MASSDQAPKFRPALLAAILLACVASVASVAAYATPVTIQNGSVQAGVSDYGTLGSDSNTEPGIQFDPSGTGNYGSGDFLTPGNPFEGFYITADGGDLSWCSNNNGDCGNFAMTSPTATSATSATWTATSSDGALSVTNVYTLTTVGGKSVISIATTLTNLSGATMNGIQFLRTLDPDQDSYTFGTPNTNNTVLSAGQVCATGPNSGLAVCLDTSSPYTHNAGVSDWDTSPADYLAGTNQGNGDNTIGIGFNLGGLDAGQSLTFDYGYAIGSTLAIASASSVPEPSGLGMFSLGALGLLGLFGVDAVRRKRRAEASI